MNSIALGHAVPHVLAALAYLCVAAQTPPSKFFILNAEINSIGSKTMLWTILVILLVLWLLGFLTHVGGGLIHLLLVIAVIVLIVNLVSGRRSV